MVRAGRRPPGRHGDAGHAGQRRPLRTGRADAGRVRGQGRPGGGRAGASGRRSDRSRAGERRHRGVRAVRPAAAACGRVVTNGGYGATQQALAAGVPVVVAGQTEDKPAIAARVGLLGLGIGLRTQRPKPEEVAGAVRQILTTPSYRDRAVELSRAYGKVDGPRLIVEVVADALRK
ncbi:glycosyltransferase [Nocardia sp. NRRL S-836]|uniref:glycosyltransferase n=1 Tax=Nocardia sp. NRRL S-836 TaxID=1519492 RepID=UPI0035104123